MNDDEAINLTSVISEFSLENIEDSEYASSEMKSGGLRIELNLTKYNE